MYGGVIPCKFILVFFNLLPFLLLLLQIDAFLLTVVSACIRLCDADNSTQSLTRIYHHTATENP